MGQENCTYEPLSGNYVCTVSEGKGSKAGQVFGAVLFGGIGLLASLVASFGIETGMVVFLAARKYLRS